MDGDEEGVGTYLGHVDRAARSIQRLMENLLELSKLERSDILPNAEAVAIGEVVSQVAADLSPLARQKSQSLTLGNLDVPPVLGVPMLLREALSNLLSNAVKYTPEGGEITVWADLGAQPQTVVLGVRDTGIGLSQADQKRLFTKFFRSADPQVQRERGTGLGLALTHTLVTRGGGTIDVESAPGQGTTFRLTLPIAAAS
jgi:signal transduction histidine kinase